MWMIGAKSLYMFTVFMDYNAYITCIVAIVLQRGKWTHLERTTIKYSATILLILIYTMACIHFGARIFSKQTMRGRSHCVVLHLNNLMLKRKYINVTCQVYLWHQPSRCWLCRINIILGSLKNSITCFPCGKMMEIGHVTLEPEQGLLT